MLAVETEDGLERNVEIIGHATSGKDNEMRVRFVDGTVDDWDADEFEPREAKAEANPGPTATASRKQQSNKPEPGNVGEKEGVDKKTRKKEAKEAEKRRKKEAKEVEKQRKLELKLQKKQLKKEKKGKR